MRRRRNVGKVWCVLGIACAAACLGFVLRAPAASAQWDAAAEAAQTANRELRNTEFDTAEWHAAVQRSGIASSEFENASARLDAAEVLRSRAAFPIALAAFSFLVLAIRSRALLLLEFRELTYLDVLVRTWTSIAVSCGLLSVLAFLLPAGYTRLGTPLGVTGALLTGAGVSCVLGVLLSSIKAYSAAGEQKREREHAERVHRIEEQERLREDQLREQREAAQLKTEHAELLKRVTQLEQERNGTQA